MSCGEAQWDYLNSWLMRVNIIGIAALKPIIHTVTQIGLIDMVWECWVYKVDQNALVITIFQFTPWRLKEVIDLLIKFETYLITA